MVSIEMGSSLAHNDKLAAIRVRATVGNLNYTRSVMHKPLCIYFVLEENSGALLIFDGKEEGTEADEGKTENKVRMAYPVRPFIYIEAARSIPWVDVPALHNEIFDDAMETGALVAKSVTVRTSSHRNEALDSPISFLAALLVCTFRILQSVWK